MDPARIGVRSDHLTNAIDPEREGHRCAREINRGVYAATQEEPMYVPCAAKVTRLRAAVIAQDVTEVVDSTGFTEIARRDLDSARNIGNRAERSIAQGINMVLSVASFVPSDDLPVVIDLPRLGVSIRAGEINRGEGSPM